MMRSRIATTRGPPAANSRPARTRRQASIAVHRPKVEATTVLASLTVVSGSRWQEASQAQQHNLPRRADLPRSPISGSKLTRRR